MTNAVNPENQSNIDVLPISNFHPLGGFSPSLALLGVSSDVLASEKYTYEPLPTEQEYIRLLEVDSAHDQVAFHLRTVALKDCYGSYEALSYVWGSPFEKANIIIDDKILPVTINLWHALHALLTKGQCRRLWIDAICVNQEDLAERSQQVQIMRRIYEYSSNVPIWLGNDEAGTAQNCFSLLRDTAVVSRDLLRKYSNAEDIPNPLMDNPICSDAKKWEMVWDMAGLPWFTRVWVLQEAGLAPRATLIWGEATINISDVVEVALISFMAGHLFPVSDVGLFKIVDTFADLWNTLATAVSWRSELSRSLVQVLENQRSKPSLTEVLHIGRRFSATDCRDYVYGFLGHPAAQDSATGQLLIYPDYEKPLLEVYYDAACALLKTAELTFILSCVDRDQAALDSDFPSWVPQWHLAHYVSALGYPTHWYQAGGSHTKATFSLNDQRHLKIRGLVLDTIVWAGQVVLGEDPDFQAQGSGQDVPVVEKIWRDLVEHKDEETRYRPEDEIDAFSITLVANTNNLDDTTGDVLNQHRESFRAYCATNGCAIDNVNLEGPKSESWRFERGIIWAAHNRRFFRTKTGYYGLAHRLIRERDVCCVFEGVRVPFVLRPVGESQAGQGRYKLVGDAYIHGVMRGEAIAMAKDGRFVQEDIIIV